MSYIGNTPTQQGFSPAIDYFSGTGSQTAFVCSRPIASTAQVTVVVNNVTQNPSTAFTVSGNTITFTGAPSLGTNNIYVSYTSSITQVIQPSQGTVDTLQLVDASVTTAKLASGAATGSKLGSDVVVTSGAQTVAGVKTFSSQPVFSAGIDLSSNGQVKFPATQSASTDANTLDDYEEGTWTPFIFGGTTAGTGTYSVQSAFYTKIGRQVTVMGFLVWSAHTGSGTMQIGGFPFSLISSGQSPLCLSEVGNIALSANNIATLQIQGGTGALFLQTPVGGGLDSSVPIDNSGYFRFSGSYFTS